MFSLNWRIREFDFDVTNRAIRSQNLNLEDGYEESTKNQMIMINDQMISICRFRQNIILIHALLKISMKFAFDQSVGSTETKYVYKTKN